jgi:DNA-binding SARP family transcriptional activator
LLEWLVAHRDTGVSVGGTIAALWPEPVGTDSRAALRGYLSRLRRCLPDRDVVFRMADDRLGLDAAVIEIDVDRFLAELSQGTDNLADGRPEVSLDHLDRALGWWRGDAYPSLQDSAIGITESNRLASRRTDAEVARCAAWIATGRPARALPALEEVVLRDPQRETAWRLLILASAVAGNRVDAARAFQDCRRELAGMGRRPDSETAALDQLVLEGAPLNAESFIRREFAGQRRHRPPAAFSEARGWNGPRVIVAVVDDPMKRVAERVAAMADDPVVIELEDAPSPDGGDLESLAKALETADLIGAEDLVPDMVRGLRSWPNTTAHDPVSSAVRLKGLSALIDTVRVSARHRALAIVVPEPVATPTLVSVLRHLTDNVGACPVLVVFASDPASARRLITATDDVLDLR